MKKVVCSFLLFISMQQILTAQVLVYPAGQQAPLPDSCAALIVQSSNQGVLLPRLTTAQRAAIYLPKAGLIIYNSDDSCFNYFNGSTWIPLRGTLTNPIPIPIIRTYTSNTVWIKPSGLSYIVVEVVGGGGGGGGCGSYGGGAGAGAGYARKIIAATTLGSTEIITIGTGGLGGPAETNGQTGGTTSFGNHCSATGGQGGYGQVSYNISTSIGSLPGVGINGDINASGQSSGGAVGNSEPRSCGGSSLFGGGAPSNANNTNTNGINATGHGSGGSGGTGYSGGYKSGGNGSGGIVIITEYY